MNFESLFALFRKAPAKPLSLEQKLELLAGCGLQLQAPFSVEDLLTSWKREDFEKEGFDLVMVGLGMTEEQPPWRNHCINAWHFDTECIEDHGDYRRIAERLREMAQGSLPIENIRDHVDVEGGSAWVEFEYQGESMRIECQVNDDWVDTRLFTRFADLLAKSDPSKVFLRYDLHGQDCVFVCVRRADAARLKKIWKV